MAMTGTQAAPESAATNGRRTAKFLYAALFCVCLPALLIAWAAATSTAVCLPVFGHPIAGAITAVGGLTIILVGMRSLWTLGGGLPMNAFPPPRLVTTGIYHVIPHPIYFGFALASFGVAMTSQSPSGLWLVSPVVVLGTAALVLGYEAHGLKQRFGDSLSERRGWAPLESDRVPFWWDRLKCYFYVLVPWVVIYEIIVVLGIPGDAADITIPIERTWPILTWTETFYGSTYFAVGLVPLLVATQRDLRRFMVRGWTAMALVFPVYLAFPTYTPRKPYDDTGVLAWMLQFERKMDLPTEAMPSFHVIWAFLTAAALAPRSRRWGWLWWVWAVGVALSCVTTGMHAIADIVVGAAVSFAFIRSDLVWRVLRGAAERLANSWREWRVGPVRIINHGVYAGLATFVGVAIVGSLTGPALAPALAITTGCGLIAAALWAQWVEGSPRLLRPFGFYGGLLGVILGAIACLPLGASPWLILGAFSVAAPWIQSIGRLRCLVQGCCHGRPTSPEIGIRYRHPQSRVCRIAELNDVPVHATPLYSILWNLFTGLIVMRIWMIGAPLHLVAGAYLILNGIGRFAEEAYRGEPQTPAFAGLKLYQWMAIASVAGGALITAFAQSARSPGPEWHTGAYVVALAFGCASALALGVDFPASNRRFARLA